MIKLKSSNETNLYISDVGYLVIVQEDLINNQEETIMLSPDQTRAVVDFINKHMEEQQKKWMETIYG